MSRSISGGARGSSSPMSGFSRLSTEVKTAFVLAAVLVIGLLAWALSLRAENAALRAELGLAPGERVLGPPTNAAEAAEGAGATPPAEAGDRADRADQVDDTEPTADNAQPAAEPNADPSEAPAPPEATSAPEHLDAAARRTLVEGLRTVPDGPTHKRVWFTVTYGDPRAAAFQTELARAFEEAGFTVARVQTAGFPIRPGLYFMMADEEPTEDVGAIGSSLEAAGLTLTTGRAYRAFYQERKRTNPSWNGFEMADDQPYVIAIGRIAE